LGGGFIALDLIAYVGRQFSMSEGKVDKCLGLTIFLKENSKQDKQQAFKPASNWHQVH
jgi:hypothetical protein